MTDSYRVIQTFECDENGELVKGGMATENGKQMGPYNEGQLLSLEIGRKRAFARDYNAREMYDQRLSNERRFHAAYLAFSTGNTCSFICRRTTRVVREGDKHYREVVKTAVPLSEVAQQMNKDPKTGKPRKSAQKLDGFIGAIGNLARREKKLGYLRNEGHVWFLVPGDDKTGPEQEPDEDSGFKADEQEWRGLNPERAALHDTFLKTWQEIRQEIRAYHRDKERARKANGVPHAAVPVPSPAPGPRAGASGGSPAGASGEGLGASEEPPPAPAGNGDPYPYKGLLLNSRDIVVVQQQETTTNPIGKAAAEYIAVDDQWVRDTFKACQKKTADVTVPEIAQLVHLKGPVILQARPKNPPGYLKMAVVNACEGESFRRFRERIRTAPSVFRPPSGGETPEQRQRAINAALEMYRHADNETDRQMAREQLEAYGVSIGDGKTEGASS